MINCPHCSEEMENLSPDKFICLMCGVVVDV